MIRSMTGYGRAEVADARLALSVECKSVNHRHLDVALKLPRALAAYEPDARRLVQAAVQRGRVDVSATLDRAEGGSAELRSRSIWRRPASTRRPRARSPTSSGLAAAPSRRLAARAAGRARARGRARRRRRRGVAACWSRR